MTHHSTTTGLPGPNSDQGRRLRSILTSAQQRGLLGPGDVERHCTHAEQHICCADPQPEQHWCDLGTGAGMPGLVMALTRPSVQVTLVDRSVTRTAFVRDAVQTLELTDRVTVICADAAELGRRSAHRERYDGVVSRAFGPPAAIAECAAGLLRSEGLLVVSEPPVEHSERWPAAALELLGLRVTTRQIEPAAFVTIRRTSGIQDRYPRPWKQIRKRPLWTGASISGRQER